MCFWRKTALVMCLMLFSFTSGKTKPIFSVLSSKGHQVKPIKLPVLALISDYYNKFQTSSNVPWSMLGNMGDSSEVKEDAESRRCLLRAAQFILDEVNSRKDILPDFQLQLYHYPKPISTIFSAQLLSDFIANTSAIMSPIYIGPSYLCRTMMTYAATTPLKAVADHDFMSSFWSMTCDSDRADSVYWPRFADRIEDGRLPAMMRFVSHPLGGNWRQIAIVTDQYALTNQRGYSPNLWQERINTVLLRNGVRVVAYVEIGDDYCAAFQQLHANTKARIILFTDLYKTCEQCISVWCASHRAGIRAPLYQLLFIGVFCAQCLKNPNYFNETSSLLYFQNSRRFECCQKTTILRQIEISIFSETFNGYYDIDNVPAYNTRAAELFDKIVDANALRMNLDSQNCSGELTKQGDYWVGFSHALLSTIVTLNATDQRLRQLSNTSLLGSIFNRNHGNATLVAKTAGEVAKTFEFYGTNGASYIEAISHCNIFQVRHNKTKDTFHYRLLAHIIPDNSTSTARTSYNFSGYLYEMKGVTIWATSDGKPPKDLAEIAHKNTRTAKLPLLILCSTALSASFLQVIMFCCRFIYCRKPNAASK